MEKPQKLQKPVPVGLRVPPQVATWLKREAAVNRRSVSAQAVFLLEQKMREPVTDAST